MYKKKEESTWEGKRAERQNGYKRRPCSRRRRNKQRSDDWVCFLNRSKFCIEEVTSPRIGSKFCIEKLEIFCADSSVDWFFWEQSGNLSEWCQNEVMIEYGKGCITDKGVDWSVKVLCRGCEVPLDKGEPREDDRHGGVGQLQQQRHRYTGRWRVQSCCQWAESWLEMLEKSAKQKFDR